MASEKDIQDIINTLIAEGVGEGEEGMRWIAETILNRAEQRGISPAEVVRQRAQYTGYENPGPAARQAQALPTARSAAQAAWLQAQGPDDPTGGANHYFNPNIVTPSWASAMTPTGQYGNHAFYTDRPAAPPRLPPSPATLSPTGAAIRQMTSPSGGNSDLQSALDRVATRERNRVVPAPAEDRVTARNRAIWQTPADPFNGDPMTPASGPVVASIPTLPRPPTTRPVQTSTIRPSASDLVRGNPQQTKQQITTVASIPTAKPKATGMSYAGQEGGAWPKVSTFPTTAQIKAATPFGGGGVGNVPYRLPSEPMLTGLPPPAGGNMAVHQVVSPFGQVSYQQITPTQIASGKTAPMPPMPIPRPPMGMGGPELPAPMPAQMSPWLALQRSLQLRPPTSPAAQKVWMTGFSDSESSGGAHGGSDKDKHRGEAIPTNSRSY